MALNRYYGGILASVAIATNGSPAALAATVVHQVGSQYLPGLAQSWTVTTQGEVIFILSTQVNGPRLAQTLTPQLPGAQVDFTAGELHVRGVDVAALLHQLAQLSVTAEGGPVDGEDPLNELAEMGGTVASATQQGGSAIRAGRNDAMAVADGAAPLAEFGKHDEGERAYGQVLEAKRGKYPQVTLTIKVIKGARLGGIKKGQIMEGRVLFAGTAVPVDLQQPANQRNLVSFYLAPGDKVAFHGLPDASLDNTLHCRIDWIERQ